MKNFGKVIGGGLLTLVFVLGIVAATSTTSHAQYRNDDRIYDRESKRERKERQRIWRERRKQQRHDRRSQDVYGTYDPYGNDRYGRNDGYGNGGYGNGGYDQAELNRGYQQGVQTGSSDGQKNQSYDPQRSRHFKNAATQAFREGFVRGYDQGYRQYAGYGNQRRSSGIGIGDILGGILGGRP